MALFQDASGRFFLRPESADDLIMRPVDETDSSVPAPGSVMIDNLLKLARFTGRQLFQARAELGLAALSGLLSTRPGTMASAAAALDYHLADKIEVVIVGNAASGDSLVREFHRAFLPNALLAVSRKGDSRLSVFEGRQGTGTGEGAARAFVCRNSTCLLPVETAPALGRQLAEL